MDHFLLHKKLTGLIPFFLAILQRSFFNIFSRRVAAVFAVRRNGKCSWVIQIGKQRKQSLA